LAKEGIRIRKDAFFEMLPLFGFQQDTSDWA
jgi:hypothetical protein